jgi:hypothetical protein
VYQFSGTTETAGQIESLGKGIMTNLAPREVRGKTVTAQKWELQVGGFSGAVVTFVGEDDSGIYILGTQDLEGMELQIFRPPQYLIKNPLRVGTAWEREGQGSSVIESADEVVTVPAGTFKRCVRIKTVNITDDDASARLEDYAWYAPRVGWVKSVMREWHRGEDPAARCIETVFQLESFGEREGD